MLSQFPHDIEQLQVFALITARLLGVFGLWWSETGKLISMRLRVVFALCLAWTVWSVQGGELTSSMNTTAFGLAVAGEVLIGLALSLGMQLLLDAMIIGGKIIAQMSGLRLGAEFDSSAEASSGLASFMRLFGIVLFFLFGGHRTFVASLLETNSMWPPGTASLGDGGFEVLIGLFGESLTLGLRVAAPAIAAFLIASLVIHTVGRGMPQLTTMTFQASMNALLLPALLFLSIGTVGWVFEQQVSSWAMHVFEMFHDRPVFSKVPSVTY